MSKGVIIAIVVFCVVAGGTVVGVFYIQSQNSEREQQAALQVERLRLEQKRIEDQARQRQEEQAREIEKMRLDAEEKRRKEEKEKEDAERDFQAMKDEKYRDEEAMADKYAADRAAEVEKERIAAQERSERITREERDAERKKAEECKCCCSYVKTGWTESKRVLAWMDCNDCIGMKKKLLDNPPDPACVEKSACGR